MEDTYLDKLRSDCQIAWSAIATARQRAQKTGEQLQELAIDETVISMDEDIIVFGSLARLEWTTGSDVD